MFKKGIVGIISQTKKITLPGFNNMPLYDVGIFFTKGIYNGYVTTRAASASFSLFLAIFPSILFFFTLIPYIPIDNIQFALLDLLANILPQKTYEAVNHTLIDIVSRPRGGMLSINFVLALIFSTNGINGIIDAFNTTYHTVETRSIIKQRLIATLLVIILFVIIITALSLIIFGTFLLDYLHNAGILPGGILFYLIQITKWGIILAILFFAISFLYYLGPAERKEFRFISAGSSLATFLVISTSLIFNYYLDHFAQYNKLYGSIGTLMMIMIWIYFNSIALLIGFELNVSIFYAKKIVNNREPLAFIIIYCFLSFF